MCLYDLLRMGGSRMGAGWDVRNCQEGCDPRAEGGSAVIDTASGGDGGRLVDLIARLEKTYRRAVDDVNRATDRDIDRAARRKMLLEFGEPTAASAPGAPGGQLVRRTPAPRGRG